MKKLKIIWKNSIKDLLIGFSSVRVDDYINLINQIRTDDNELFNRISSNNESFKKQYKKCKE